MTVSLCPPVEHVVCAVSWSTKAAFLCRTVKIWAASVRLNLKCHLWSHSGILASYAQQFCGRPPLQENRIVGGVDATDGSWPWQVDIQVGPSGTATILCACSRLHVRFSVVYQTDPLREGFACDAEVTHSFFFLPSASRQTLMVISVEAPSSQRTGSCQPLIVSSSKKISSQKNHQVDFSFERQSTGAQLLVWAVRVFFLQTL